MSDRYGYFFLPVIPGIPGFNTCIAEYFNATDVINTSDVKKLCHGIWVKDRNLFPCDFNFCCYRLGKAEFIPVCYTVWICPYFKI